jgi:MinD-like ATPase involved in chromosome partitioning or flagellar assembly
VTAVLAKARVLGEFVVVDCGFCLEQDEELAYDTDAPRRNGATLAVLAAADVTLSVAAADPLGLARYLRARGELTVARAGGELVTVVNRVRRVALGPGDPQVEIAAALQRYAGVTDPVMLADDPEATDAALAEGRLLCEVAPKSPARLGIRDLAVRLVDAPAKQRRGVLAALRGARR